MHSNKQTSVIVPPKGLRMPHWGQMWRYRDLIHILVWRDIKVRYRQTLLGATWVLIQPLFSMIVFSVFLGKFSRVPSDEVPYPLFSYVGIMVWTYFSGQLTRATGCIVSNGQLISKIYFPRLILPVASVIPGLLDFALSFLFFFVLLGWFHWPLSFVGLLQTVPLMTLMVLFILGLSFWLGIINVKYRDVSQALPFLLQVWMFITPVVYASSVIPEKYRFLCSINPMTGIVEGFRSALLGRPWNTESLMTAIVTTFLFLATGIFLFQRAEPGFADRI